MPAPIPQVLSPYLSGLSVGSLLLVTSVLNAPANWLVVRCISSALHGDQNVHPVNRNDTTRASNARRVVLLSFLRPLILWVEIGKKAVRVDKTCRTLLLATAISDQWQGLDVPALLANRRILYIDGLDIYGASASLSGLAGSFSIRSHALKEVQNVLERTLEASYEFSRTAAATADTKTGSHDASDRPVLIIDGLDFLIASQPDVTATAVSQMLTNIRQHVRSTILTVSSDGPLLHGNSVSTTPSENEHQALVAALAHQSQLVMQLRSLDTGAAKDISGVIRISYGGAYEDEPEEQSLAEGEWLYKVSGDGSVLIWGRGE